MPETTGPAASPARNYREVARGILVKSLYKDGANNEASTKISAALKFMAAVWRRDVGSLLAGTTGLNSKGMIDGMSYSSLYKLYEELKKETGPHPNAAGPLLGVDEVRNRVTWKRHVYALWRRFGRCQQQQQQQQAPHSAVNLDVMWKSVIQECGEMDTFPAVQAYIGWKKALNFAHIDDPRCRPSDISALATFSAYHEWWVNRPRLARRQRRGGTARASAGDAPAMASACGADEGDREDGDGDHIAFDESFGGGTAAVNSRAPESNECSIQEATAASRISAPPVSRFSAPAEQQRPSKRQRMESEDTGGSLETPGVVDARTGSFDESETSNAGPTGGHEMRYRPTGAVSVSALSNEEEDAEEFFNAENGDDNSKLYAPPSAGPSPTHLPPSAGPGEVSLAEATEADSGRRRSAVDGASETSSPPTPSTRGDSGIVTGPDVFARGPSNINTSSNTNPVPPLGPMVPSWAQAVIEVHEREKKDLQAQLFDSHKWNGVLDEKNRVLEENNRRLEGIVQSLKDELDAKAKDVEVFKETTMAELDEAKEEARRRQDELDALKKQYKEDCEKLRGDLDAEKQAHHIEVFELQRKLQESADQFDAVQRNLAVKEGSLKALTLQVEVHETERAEKDENARNRQVELDQYKAECTRLRSDLDSGKQAHEDNVRELERQLEKSVDQCEELRNKLEKATGDAEDWQHQWELVSDQLFTDQTELGVLKEELETLKKQIEDNEKTIKDYKQRVSTYYAKNQSLRQRLAGLGQPLQQEEPMPDACASSNVKVEDGEAVGSAASPDRTTSGAPREELPAATT
jgi:hypothetical protein